MNNKITVTIDKSDLETAIHELMKLHCHYKNISDECSARISTAIKNDCWSEQQFDFEHTTMVSNGGVADSYLNSALRLKDALDAAKSEDDDNPEITDFSGFRPSREVVPEIVAAYEAGKLTKVKK